MKITMRIIHRYLGFFLVGIMSVYAFSGIVLTFRDTSFLKIEKQFEKQLKPNIQPDLLGRELKMRHFKIDDINGDIISFNSGTYNSSTGVVNYTQSQYPRVINNMTKLHKTPSSSGMYWLTTMFGVALLFLAISSLWMFKPKTKIFKQGVFVTAIGLVITIILIYL